MGGSVGIIGPQAQPLQHSHGNFAASYPRNQPHQLSLATPAMYCQLSLRSLVARRLYQNELCYAVRAMQAAKKLNPNPGSWFQKPPWQAFSYLLAEGEKLERLASQRPSKEMSLLATESRGLHTVTEAGD